MNVSPLTSVPSLRLPSVLINIPADDGASLVSSNLEEEVTLVSSSCPSSVLSNISADNRANAISPTPNHEDLEARAAEADSCQRTGNKIFLVALAMMSGSAFVNWLEGEEGLPILTYALCVGLIPITLIFSGLMLRLCAEFEREEISESLHSSPRTLSLPA